MVRKLFIEMESLKSGSEPPTPIVSLYTDGEMNLMDFGATSETKNELIRSESAMSLDQEVVAIEDVADNTGPRATVQLRDIDLEGYWKGERWVEIMGGFRNHEAALQLLFSMMSESFRSYLIIDPLPEFLSLEESTARTQSPSEFCRDLALHFSQGIEAYFEQRKKSLVEKGIMDEEVSIRELDIERTRVLSLGLDHDPKSVDPPDLNPVFHLHMPFLPTSCPDLSTYLDRYFYQNPPEEGFEHPYLYSVADHLILPIVREALPAGTWGWGQDYDRTILSFPKVLRVDKYLYDNREQIMECRKSLTVFAQKEEALLKEQKDLSTQDGKNWSDCLQRLADYFTTSEAAPEEEERGKFHQEAKEVFEKMKSVVERRGIEIDEEIKQIQQNKSTIWERDVFHQHDPYVLEAVLMHDGGKERKSVWSYVRVINGEEEQWWRVDDQVTPVDEAHVFTDPAGFALNAGTCMLFYGREKIESLDIAIPQRIRAAIDTDNAHLYAEIEQEPQD
ncbi:hypothetical protein BT69DRAFT_129835 [Atractiella rhizophila]|nr:hypothetical protein BT69DRAFT_129835 [Atractiella rhizophila]